MDITCIPMARGIVYLAAVIDWFSRGIVAATPTRALSSPAASLPAC